MKIYKRIVIDMDTWETIEEDSYEYDGPIALCGGSGSAGVGAGGSGSAGVDLGTGLDTSADTAADVAAFGAPGVFGATTQMGTGFDPTTGFNLAMDPRAQKALTTMMNTLTGANMNPAAFNTAYSYGIDVLGMPAEQASMFASQMSLSNPNQIAMDAVANSLIGAPFGLAGAMVGSPMNPVTLGTLAGFNPNSIVGLPTEAPTTGSIAGMVQGMAPSPGAGGGLPYDYIGTPINAMPFASQLPPLVGSDPWTLFQGGNIKSIAEMLRSQYPDIMGPIKPGLRELKQVWLETLTPEELARFRAGEPRVLAPPPPESTPPPVDTQPPAQGPPGGELPPAEYPVPPPVTPPGELPPASILGQLNASFSAPSLATYTPNEAMLSPLESSVATDFDQIGNFLGTWAPGGLAIDNNPSTVLEDLRKMYPF